MFFFLMIPDQGQNDLLDELYKAVCSPLKVKIVGPISSPSSRSPPGKSASRSPPPHTPQRIASQPEVISTPDQGQNDLLIELYQAVCSPIKVKMVGFISSQVSSGSLHLRLLPTAAQHYFSTRGDISSGPGPEGFPH
jgi:hypothetical protein